MPKRKVFISYHHGGDQAYYDAFSKTFSQQYELFSDNSLERALQSDNTDYVRWSIKEKNIKGSSCTIVLVGPNTWGRKYVDWEIKYTLDMKHGLICILLPHTPISNGGSSKPDRLQDNIDSGYAKFLNWNSLTTDTLKKSIEEAATTSSNLIKNDRSMRQRNA